MNHDMQPSPTGTHCTRCGISKIVAYYQGSWECPVPVAGEKAATEAETAAKDEEARQERIWEAVRAAAGAG
jgi:uncharacterized Zn finger protein (UPF0148 family)